MSTAMRDAEREMQLRAHLREIDDRLERSIRTRNEYFDYMKSKYPNLSSERMETSQSEERSERGRFSSWNQRGVRRIITRDPSNPDPHAQSMLILTPQDVRPQSRLRDGLKTNVYHWDVGRNVAPRNFVPPAAPLPRLSDPIPPNGGLIIDSDLPRIRARLAEIKSDLTDLRDQRMFMSSADYHRTILPSKDPFLSSLNVFKGGVEPPKMQHQNPYDYAIPNGVHRRTDRSFAEILNKLTEIAEEQPPTEEMSVRMPSISEAPSQKDVHIDRMFEKMREQVREDTVAQERPPTSPPRRSPKESSRVKRSMGINFGDPTSQSPKMTPAVPQPTVPSYSQILASMEAPKTKVESSSDYDCDHDVPKPAPTTSAPAPAENDFLARFLSTEKKPTTSAKVAPPIDLDDDDFY